MPLVTEMAHPRGLSFASQRAVVVMRDQGMAYTVIAPLVRNLQGEEPTARTCANIYNAFNRKLGRVRNNYCKCGRQPWKVTRPIESYLLRRLRELRRQTLCTSTTLQSVLAREKGIQLATSTIRAVFRRNGYHWLARSNKRLYNADDKRARMQFARKVLKMTKTQVRERMSMCMDGVILARPPQDMTDRINFLRSAETHVWRKRAEGALPELDANDPYKDQVPPARAVPM